MKQYLLISFIFTLLLALTANLVWLYEITEVFGWNSLNWLKQQAKSIYLINLFVILAYLFPFLWKRRNSLYHISIAIIVLYFGSMIAFFVAKELLFLYYSRVIAMKISWLIVSFVFICLMMSLIYHIVTYHFIQKVKFIQTLLLLFAMLLVFLQSNISIQLWIGFGNARGFVDSVKMGYPYFWIIINLGIAGYLSSTLLEKNTEIQHTDDQNID